jgi:RimJ/RimL family protein N-acetyltransferase
VRLETRRLSLRPITGSDVGVLLRIHTDPELMAQIHRGRTHTRRECRDDLDRALAGWSTEGFGTFVVERDDELVGTVGFGRPTWCPAAMPGPDIGWTIVQDHQRHGYATEAGAALLDWFFAEARGRRVVGIHNTSNPRSGAVMDRLGMRWRRRLDHPQLGYPIELWEHTAATWRVQRGAAPSSRGASAS